ncbi:Crp/Fnr family transcriptional regulator [Dyadobacter sp. CY261]|uniref:Crp/Fnr family transcriptional regulator n=1 Tax=Dyadobacter sp. CY261 TaxID=2907203 RepID=UPI001F383E00|nr:Crp/Fnr family transcriptional regulator [Dyadobacter sp. CY261]MCF0069282.1 Crp/Fnr family transcriptional regulator [Dyadobacter sp. CY261]
MFNSYRAVLNLPESKWEEFQCYYNRLEVPARTILLQEGEISKRAYLIEKGCVRVWFNNDGMDTTFQFFFENESVSSVESFRRQIPSPVTVETVEPCVLHWIHKDDLDQVFGDIYSDPANSAALSEMLFERQLHYMKHCISFIKHSPADRYVQLLRESPHIIQRVPQHYIASYLGITPVSLSRIRKKLMREGKI